jgi:hypothetical protein
VTVKGLGRFLRGNPRQLEEESAALPDLVLGPHSPAVMLNDPPDDCQPASVARKRAPGSQPLEDGEPCSADGNLLQKRG